jgi:hypothetical protein
MTMATSLVLVLLLSGGGIVAASGSSMPDSPLYSVKLASEQARLFFTFSDEGKAELYTRLVDERVDEIIKMASENNAEAVKKSTNIMRDQLSMLAIISGSENVSVDTPKTVDKTTGMGGLSIPTITETSGGPGQEVCATSITTSTTEETRTDTKNIDSALPPSFILTFM